MSQILSPGALPPEPMPKPAAAQWKENLNVKYICKECKLDPPYLIEDHTSGDVMCGECGLIISERNIDMSSEWRTFSNDDQGNDDPSRVGDGPNSLLHGDQLDTQIKFEGGIRNKDLARAQKTATTDKANKTLMQAYKEIGALADAWQLPTGVSDKAKYLFKVVDESKAFKGKPYEVILAGCVFCACREAHVPRTFREVMDLTKVTKKELGRFVKLLITYLKEHEKKDDPTKETKSVETSDNIAQTCIRFCNRMNLEQSTANATEALATNVDKDGRLTGRSPLSIVAAVIFMACQMMGKARSAKEIGDHVGVSDSTIRQSYKILYGFKDTLITEDILKRGADPEKLSKPA